MRAVCRRYRLTTDESEEFSAQYRLRLVQDGCAVIRRFEGRSSLRTFVEVVITRAFQDWRNARWGKWRPSAEARRLGPVAEELETLIVRDGLTMEEAYGILSTGRPIDLSREQAELLVARFPVRTRRHFVPDEQLVNHPSAGTSAEARVNQQQAVIAARAASRALQVAVEELPAQDQLILRMRFEDEASVVDIASALHLEVKPLYRRLERVLLQLRSSLEQRGLTSDEVALILDESGFDHVRTGPFWPGRENDARVRLNRKNDGPLGKERAG